MLPEYCDGCTKVRNDECLLYHSVADAIQLRDNGDVVRGCILSPKSEYQQAVAKKKKRVGQQKGRRGKRGR